jgi:hypothetical protein
VEAFAADQHLGPVDGLAGELPAAGGEVAQIQSPAAGVAARSDHDDDLGDVGGEAQVCSRTATRRLAAARSTGGVAVMN